MGKQVGLEPRLRTANECHLGQASSEAGERRRRWGWVEHFCKGTVIFATEEGMGETRA